MDPRRRLLLVGVAAVFLTIGCRDGGPVGGPSGPKSIGAEAPPTGKSIGAEAPPTGKSIGAEAPPTTSSHPERSRGTSGLDAAVPEIPRPPSVARDDNDDAPERIRASALAGAWYPGEASALAEMVDGYLDAASASPTGYPIALLSPHAGLRYSGGVAGHAYAALRGRTYHRVFVIGPSHRAGFRGISVPNFTHYETPLGQVPVDTATAAQLRTHPLFADHTDAHLQEHSVEIQLPFIQRALDGTPWTFVPLLAGRMDPAEAAEAGAWLKTVVAPGDLLVASSDFTHWGRGYGYGGPPGETFGPEEAPERLPALMEAAWSAIRTMDAARFWTHKRTTGDTICGFLPIAVLLAAVPEGTTPSLRAADTSGAISGDWSRSVSYLAGQFSGLWPYTGAGMAGALDLTAAEKAALLRLARGTVEAWVREGGGRTSRSSRSPSRRACGRTPGSS